MLDAEGAMRLMRRFFVQGSIPPEISGPAPVFEFNQHQAPGQVFFATDLDADLTLLSEFLGVSLFHYGPALWRIGYTTHYQNLNGNTAVSEPIPLTQRKAIWQNILGRCAPRTIEPGSDIFRVRRGDDLPQAVSTQFDIPPAGLAGGGRYESERIPIFYGADDVETCLHESRVTLSDWIALGTLTPTRALRLLDLADDIDDSSARTPFDRVDILMRRLAFSGKQDYHLCRELAIEIHALGYDGFYFLSYFAQAHEKPLKNIALFGHPVEKGILRLMSVNRVRLTRVSYEYSFGPHHDTTIPIDKSEIHALADKMRDGTFTITEAASELQAILDRRSDGPR